ncbi:hypothetical protein EYF80_049896 [Liparis tanakae]|uniref:Uncharacterized protein n=1 Tax=Liparis tanakae TaxID=230148 RepID=A0A4Z2FFI8_9TELE|nr:hypothetical protein EYF80_049896 [Liparis tanakae]
MRSSSPRGADGPPATDLYKMFLGTMPWEALSQALSWEKKTYERTASSSVFSSAERGGMADWAGGQWSPSVLPFTEYSGVRPSVMSKVRNTRNSSASYSKNSSVASG